MIVWNLLVLSFCCIAAALEGKKCSSPPQYAHTVLVKKYTSRKDFDSGDKVYYQCAENLIPSSGLRVVWCRDGEWTKLTLKCQKKSCGNAGELPNGQFNYEGNSHVGEKVYAVCNEGYSLKGLNYMICKESGWAGDVPACEESKPTCPPPVVANSARPDRRAPAAHRLGDTVTITCGARFRLDGAQNITCSPGGHWLPKPPRCLPTIVATKSPAKQGACGAPPATSKPNVNLDDKYVSMTSFANGDRVYYKCDLGYTPTRGSRIRVCRQGKWSPLLLRCARKLCGSAGEILHGEFSYTGLRFGDVATAVCDRGHRLVGRGTRNCMVKGWDGRVPVCEAVECDMPPMVLNGEIRSNNEQSYPYMSAVSYRCLTGTLIGSKAIWCTENGTWSSPPPTCEEITCPPPNVAKGYWSPAKNGYYREGDIIPVDCNPGHRLIGPSYITCGRNGRWSPGLPQCSPISRHVRGH